MIMLAAPLFAIGEDWTAVGSFNATAFPRSTPTAASPFEASITSLPVWQPFWTYGPDGYPVPTCGTPPQPYPGLLWKDPASPIDIGADLYILRDLRWSGILDMRGFSLTDGVPMTLNSEPPPDHPPKPDPWCWLISCAY